MANVFDVAQELLDLHGEMTAMKLQKLVYYCQAWHLVWAEKPLFNNRIEAWKDGPVCPDLWKAHANLFAVKRIRGGDPSKLSKSEKQNIKKVLDFYGNRTAQWLSDLTHMEDPWLKARSGVPATERASAEITHASMHDYYASL